ncbi:MAG: LacI family DNA-binding transcriptional regulator [Ethanoligenens sp.]
MRVTISDIAKAANVTPSTVSRVVAGSSLISVKTTNKVRRVMREMGYHPNMIARSLVRRSTNIVAALLPGSSEQVFQHPFFSGLLQGVMSQAKAHGYEVILANIDNEAEEQLLVEHFMGSGVAEGMILLVSRVGQTSLESAVQSAFPVSMVGRPIDAWVDRISWVDSDNFAAGYNLTRYFLQKGRRQIAFVGLVSDIVVTMDRFAGYRHALKEADIPMDERLVVEGRFMDGDEHLLTKELLARGVRFDGLIAADDYQAFAAIKLLSQNGLTVPRDVVVAGFNNVPLAEYFSPSLTSVDVRPSSIGEKAFDLLYQQIENKAGKPLHVIVPTALIPRASG